MEKYEEFVEMVTPMLPVPETAPRRRLRKEDDDLLSQVTYWLLFPFPPIPSPSSCSCFSALLPLSSPLLFYCLMSSHLPSSPFLSLPLSDVCQDCLEQAVGRGSRAEQSSWWGILLPSALLHVLTLSERLSTSGGTQHVRPGAVAAAALDVRAQRSALC